MLKEIVSGCASLVFPPHCYLCRQHNRSSSSTDWLCHLCLDQLVRNGPPFCIKCSRQLKPPLKRSVCPHCFFHPIHFDFAWSAYIFNEPLRRLLHLFKYYQKTGLRLLFGKLMVKFIEDYRFDVFQFDWIVPIPLFPSNLRERGYNQSTLLAKEIAFAFDIPLAPGLLTKTHPTKNQVDLTEKERWTNIEGAFKIKHSACLKDRHILIVDDLLTTGATVSEAARTLKIAGCSTVGVLTLAITP